MCANSGILFTLPQKRWLAIAWWLVLVVAVYESKRQRPVESHTLRAAPLSLAFGADPIEATMARLDPPNHFPGIAVLFKRQLGVLAVLGDQMKNGEGVGSAIYLEKHYLWKRYIFYLVIKEICYCKPTYPNLQATLEDLATKVRTLSIFDKYSIFNNRYSTLSIFDKF